MILQNLRIPEPDQCLDTRAYYLSSPEDILNFREGESLDLTSYFNCLSLGKWRRYTTVSDIFLGIEICGEFELELVSNVSDIIHHETISTERSHHCTRVPNDAKGLISIRLRSLSDGSAFYGGCFFTDSSPVNNVRLALNICTYKREEYVRKKMEDFLKYLDEFNDGYPESVEIFVVDNAGTLSDVPDDCRIHLIRNRNYGGSGGYARGIFEIRKNGRFTHSVFIDDDTVLDFESVYRLYSFLSYQKDEWKDSLIGGAMMRKESPCIMYESSALMTEDDEVLNDNEIDISDSGSLLSIDEEKISNYNGWWFCCSPHLGDNDYPAPMFVAYDDVEYGARYGRPVITLNGIAVWHDSFDSKYSVARYYYDYRNMMVARAMNGRMTLSLLMKVLYHSALETLYTRYDNSDMFLRGMYDFFKGPEFLENIDPEQLNKELIGIGRLSPVSELPIKFDECEYKKSLAKIDGNRDYLRSIITLNGILLPSKGNVIAPLKVKKMSVFYRAERVLHCDAEGKNGFVTELDRGRALKRLISIPFLFLKYSVKLKKVSKEYENRAEYLRSEEFWKHSSRTLAFF